MRTQIAECKLIILGLVVLISGCLHVTQILLLGLGTICSPVPLNVKEFFLLSLCFLSPVGSLLLLQLHRRVHTHTHSTKWRFCLIQIMSVRLHWSIPGDTFLNKDSNDFSGLPSFVPGQTVSCSLPFLLWWVWSLWFLQIFLSKFIRIWQKVHILMKKCSLNALISLEIWIVDSKSALCNLSCSPAQVFFSSIEIYLFYSCLFHFIHFIPHTTVLRHLAVKSSIIQYRTYEN